MAKKSDNSPYGGHTVEEVMQVEANGYYIQIGDGMFESETGKTVFSKERAEHFFGAVWEGLMDMKNNGDAEEKEEALKCLLNFRIVPLRFH